MRNFSKISVLLVLLSFAVSGLSIIAEETTTETFEEPIELVTDIIFTTTPPGCWNQEKPFEDTPCGRCECTNWSGQWDWICYMASCARPPCEDYVTEPGQCCPICPNGPSCNYNGVSIRVDEIYLDQDGSVCRCIDSDSYWQPPEVMCEPPMPPTTPPGCQEDNTFANDPCAHCQCVEWEGKFEWACYMVDCFDAPCVDKISVPGQCCQECPNGPNCEAFGEIIPLEETRVINGSVCHCSYETIWNPPIAVCEDMTFVPPPRLPPIEIIDEAPAATVE